MNKSNALNKSKAVQASKRAGDKIRASCKKRAQATYGQLKDLQEAWEILKNGIREFHVELESAVGEKSGLNWDELNTEFDLEINNRRRDAAFELADLLDDLETFHDSIIS